MKKIIITEDEKYNILKMYNLLSEDIKRPLQKLMECKFTTDGKYVIYEGKAFLISNGEQVPINEEWTLSDILHTGADILSMGLDFVIPGSGAVVDILNGISYVIEAQFKEGEEKDSLYLMAVITFGFVLLPGPLQAIAIPLKRAIKTGAGMTSKVVVNGLKIIGRSIDTLLLGLPAQINSALKSPLAKNIMGKWSTKISGFIDNFTTRIRQLLNKITGETGAQATTKGVREVSGDVFKERFTLKDCFRSNWCDTETILTNFYKILPNPTLTFNPSKVKVLSKSDVAGREIIEVQVENGQKILFYKSSGANAGTTGKQAGEWFTIPGFAENGWFIKTRESINITKGGNQYLTSMAEFLNKNGVEGLTKSAFKEVTQSTITAASKKSLNAFFKTMPKISQGKYVLRKLGFVVNKPYRYVGKSGKATTATIKEITNEGVSLVFKNGTTTMVPVETFIRNAVGAPWMRRGYSVTVPFFIKRFADAILPDGNIDYDKLETLPDLNPDETSQESLSYLGEEIADYQGNTGQYTTNDTVLSFQNALKMLGYDLGTFGRNKDGVDGKFGPKTQEALKKFQTENNLQSSTGKMDRLTARKLSETLKSKNIQNSEEIQSKLNSF